MLSSIAIYGSHDASICFKDANGKYRIFEIERLTKERYATLNQPNYSEIYQKIKEIGKLDSFEICYYSELPEEQINYLQTLFQIKEFKLTGHHLSHAACAYYQSGFQDSLIISFDGGGFDGGEGDDRVTYFNIYLKTSEHNFTRLERIKWDMGSSYGELAVPISEIKKTEDWGKTFLSYAGKKMGLCGFGKIIPQWIQPIKIFYQRHKHLKLRMDLAQLEEEIGLKLEVNSLSGQTAYDLAATSQHVFEELVLEVILPFIEKYQLPICLTGGCALNVIFNQKLKQLTSLPIFIPPNPSDCGLAFGMLAFHEPPLNPPNLTYAGFEILDQEKLPEYIQQYQAKPISTKEIAGLLAEGKILGIMRGNSEVGPRALGNRSLLCDPSIPSIKDKLNAQIKFREWFRPFAPMVREEENDKYFQPCISPFMSYSPQVKEEWKEKLAAIVHVDGSARVQTIKKEENEFIYDLLGKFEKIKGFGVLLNTSFNIKGKPILTTIEDALVVLEETELDGVVIEGWLFE